MRAARGLIATSMSALVILGMTAGPAASQSGKAEIIVVPIKVVAAPKPMSVVAHIDTGVNPYAPAFRDKSPLAYKHPSTYIAGYPKDAQALKLTLDKPFDEAFKADEAKWKLLKRGELYWIPGTKIVGAISMSAGGTYCPQVKVPTVIATSDGSCSEHVILDDHGHGTMTGSRATGIPDSLAPEARLVTIEGLGANSVEWATDQGWIDVQTNSWVNLVPTPIPGGTSEAFYVASQKMITLAASGNGTAYLAGVAPTPTYVLSTAPRGVILVGGHDNGRATLWSGAPPHVVADAYMGMAASARTTDKMHPEIMACCTSAASPYAAGGAATLVLEARKILKDRTLGVTDGVLACGKPNAVKDGPLKDGIFTIDEFKDVFFHSAEPFPGEGKDDGEVHWSGGLRPPDQVEYGPGGNPYCPGCTTTPVPWSTVPTQADGLAYQFVGYGGINERSVKLAIDVLRGKAQVPERAAADAQYELDQTLRDIFFSANGFEAPAEPVEFCPALAFD
jgi:Subtilase family